MSAREQIADGCLGLAGGAGQCQTGQIERIKAGDVIGLSGRFLLLGLYHFDRIRHSCLKPISGLVEGLKGILAITFGQPCLSDGRL